MGGGGGRPVPSWPSCSSSSSDHRRRTERKGVHVRLVGPGRMRPPGRDHAPPPDVAGRPARKNAEATTTDRTRKRTLTSGKITRRI